jgi:hypothetical protein
MILEPFEVDEPVQFAGKSQSMRERFLQNRAHPAL